MDATREQIKLGYIYQVKCYTAINKNEVAMC